MRNTITVTGSLNGDRLQRGSGHTLSFDVDSKSIDEDVNLFYHAYTTYTPIIIEGIVLTFEVVSDVLADLIVVQVDEAMALMA